MMKRVRASSLEASKALVVALVLLGLAGRSDGQQMKLIEDTRGLRGGDKFGGMVWWDAVTGADEYGDVVTTFMHKRWGTALQLYHESHHSYLPFRFIPNVSWMTGDKRPEALMFYGPGELETVDYWFASKHLEELMLARDADSLLAEEMKLGGWRGKRYGNNMLFEHGAVLFSQLDDTFTTPRQLVLTEEGFIYLGLAGIGVSVLYDDLGKLRELPGIRGEPQHGGACVLYQNFELRAKILPQLLGVKASLIQKYMESFVEMMKTEAVQQRANNPAARLIAPENWSKRKKGWTWVGKGSGNLQDGALPYGQ